MAVDPRAPAETQSETLWGNPFVEFMRTEVLAGIASIVVYLVSRAVAYATEHIAGLLPLHERAPSDFIELVLGWGAAFNSTATFLVITVYQLVVLIRRLWGTL